MILGHQCLPLGSSCPQSARFQEETHDFRLSMSKISEKGIFVYFYFVGPRAPGQGPCGPLREYVRNIQGINKEMYTEMLHVSSLYY